MDNLRLRKTLAIFLPLLVLAVAFAYPSVSKVFNTKRLQETNFELSVLEFKGENLNTKENPAKAFFKYKDKLIPLKIVNKDLYLRVVVELPRFPDDVNSHFLDGELLISGGDVPATKPQSFSILLVRQPTANTRLEKINKLITDTENINESQLSKQMGSLITRLQAKFQDKSRRDFVTETKNINIKFETLDTSLSLLNNSFESSLEELEQIDLELANALLG